MSRHSKHANDRQFYSHQERKEAGFATSRKEVMGTDCFLPFGFCALSVKAPKDPVTTPDGWIYERQAILECILEQKLRLTEEKQKFDDQERKKAQQEAGAKRKEEMKEIEDFQKAEQGVLADDDTRHAVKRKQVDRENPDDIYSHMWSSAAPAKKLREGELMTIDKTELAKTSFWSNTATQTAAPAPLKKVVVETRCPMSGKKLRVKDLLKIKFEVTDQKKFDQGGERGVFCCAVSKHPITHQQAVLIKPSNQVVLESVLKDCVWPEMKCPVTGTPLESKDDVMKLQMGGTGFRAHNETQVKVFASIRSRAGDDRLQSGHLPRAGYVGLK